MSLGDDLKTDVAKIFRDAWTERDGQKVPEPKDLKLGNDAVKLDGTVLYADLADSTDLVDGYKPWFAAEVYKTYLHCAAKIIRSEGGVITSYDGDRIMSVFIGGQKNTTAARVGLKINNVVLNIINPALKKRYPKLEYEVKQTVGIDTSKLFVARTGIRGSNDLVWVGRAANYAAKLATLSPSTPTWITNEVYEKLLEGSKIGNDKKNMWQPKYWTAMNNKLIYCSNYNWTV